jgi:small subunit ribosomal protein S4
MGDPRKQHKKYARPRKLFEKTRMSEEDELLKKYGLKNKREIWKGEFKIENIRKQAKSLINSTEKQKEFLEKLRGQGLNVKTIDEVLSLKKENLFERRLQTMLVRKGLTRTFKHARQIIAHKHVAVAGRIINIPSYLVPVELEKDIRIISKAKNIKSKLEESQ